MERCESERSSDAAGPGAVESAVAAAMEGGVTMDEVVARVGAWDGEGSGSDEGHSAAGTDGLIGLQREAGRLSEEWERDREPGAEEGSARVAIESLRALTLRTMAQLSAGAEPVSAVEIGRLSLTLQRIEGADRLRIEREQAVAGAGLSHGGEVQGSGWSIEGDPLEWPQRAVEEVPEAEWAGDWGGDPDAASPAPAPDTPFDDAGEHDASVARGAHEATDREDANATEDASDAREAPDTRDARRRRDVRAVPDAPDDDAYSVARDVEMRRRDRERLLWPTDPPFCPALWHTFG